MITRFQSPVVFIRERLEAKASSLANPDTRNSSVTDHSAHRFWPDGVLPPDGVSNIRHEVKILPQPRRAPRRGISRYAADAARQRYP